MQIWTTEFQAAHSLLFFVSFKFLPCIHSTTKCQIRNEGILTLFEGTHTLVFPSYCFYLTLPMSSHILHVKLIAPSHDVLRWKRKCMSFQILLILLLAKILQHKSLLKEISVIFQFSTEGNIYIFLIPYSVKDLDILTCALIWRKKKKKKTDVMQHFFLKFWNSALDLWYHFIRP